MKRLENEVREAEQALCDASFKLIVCEEELDRAKRDHKSTATTLAALRNRLRDAKLIRG